MKDILIIGAGGLGREIYGYVEDCIAAGKEWRIKGFLDDNLNALDGYDYPHGIVSAVKDYKPAEGEALIMALGSPRAKKRVVELLKPRGAKFETLIHPTARIGRNVTIGEGSVFTTSTGATCDVKIGNFVTVNASSGFGHDSSAGDWTTVSGHCDIMGFAQLGEGVFLASGVSLIPSAKVGDWASVGVNSAVIMNVKVGTSVFGNPAVKIGQA